LFFKLRKSDRFKPDLYIDEGYDFSGYGFDAKVLELPGHSKGSIGTLMTSGDLFCGDLLVNTDKPAARALAENTETLNVKAAIPWLLYIGIAATLLVVAVILYNVKS
jgi:glyoxylase-like metal-dependent hydrolase (beta-lactamase superfamily II)